MELALLVNLLASGIRTGTSILFATIGEIFAERAGVLNLGVEGMMIFGAMTAYGVGYYTGNPWLGLLAAAAMGGLLALLHAYVTVTLHADQVVSGLALTFVGTGLASVLGAPLVDIAQAPRLPSWPIPILSEIPILGPILFDHNAIVYLGFLLIPVAWFYINRTRPGLELRAIGEYPAAADVQGINVVALRYLYVFVGGVLAGMGGAALTLAVSPRWIEGITSGQGWIAVGLVIFAQWDPVRAAIGSYLFGAIRRLPLDLQNVGIFLRNPALGYFTNMLPYLFTVIVLIIGSRAAMRRRMGAPAALGQPYNREQRGAWTGTLLLPSAHVAYSWFALTLLQDTLHVAPDADYRGVALAAMGSDLVDKPLAAAYFYRKHKAAVLFAHTLLAYVAVAAWTWASWPRGAVYGVTILGHAVLDRIWFFPDTFYWPLRGWRFHVWGKQGSEQKEIGKAYWFAFTRRPELWLWELGGLLALAWVVWRHRLYVPSRLLNFLLTGRPAR